jgi:lambda repressor-like predicted transcriptional regulator
MHDISIRKRVADLRKAGYSYTHISRVTGLSKSTLSDWLSAVPYCPNEETIQSIGMAIARANAKKTEMKRLAIVNIHKEAAAQIGVISKRDLFMFGLGLYMGEGSKTADITRIVNADPNVLRIAIAWFYGLGIRKDQFLLTLHLYPDSNVEESLLFWSRATTIPSNQFGAVQIDRRTNKKHVRRGILPHGTAHLTVRGLGRKEFGVALARRIKGWSDGVTSKIELK